MVELLSHFLLVALASVGTFVLILAFIILRLAWNLKVVMNDVKAQTGFSKDFIKEIILNDASFISDGHMLMKLIFNRKFMRNYVQLLFVDIAEEF